MDTLFAILLLVVLIYALIELGKKGWRKLKPKPEEKPIEIINDTEPVQTGDHPAFKE